jgi:hypothetical protein
LGFRLIIEAKWDDNDGLDMYNFSEQFAVSSNQPQEMMMVGTRALPRVLEQILKDFGFLKSVSDEDTVQYENVHTVFY